MDKVVFNTTVRGRCRSSITVLVVIVVLSAAPSASGRSAPGAADVEADDIRRESSHRGFPADPGREAVLAEWKAQGSTQVLGCSSLMEERTGRSLICAGGGAGSPGRTPTAICPRPPRARTSLAVSGADGQEFWRRNTPIRTAIPGRVAADKGRHPRPGMTSRRRLFDLGVADLTSRRDWAVGWRVGSGRRGGGWRCGDALHVANAVEEVAQLPGSAHRDEAR